MSELTSLNDSELIDLEQRLTGVKLTPTSRQRERLLYSCGHAAGRAELRGRVRLMSASTGLLVCLSAGLSCLLLTDTPRRTNVLDPTGPALVDGEQPDSRISSPDVERPRFVPNRRSHLSAGTNFDQWLIAESLRNTEPMIVAPPSLSSKQVLTAASRSWPEELWE